MRLLSIYKTAETSTPPSAEYVAKMQKLVEDSMKAGQLLATEGCLPSALGARVRHTGGKVTVTVEILAPNQRPVQTTGDLGNFWKTSYTAVKTQLKGRYPKHEWR